MSGSASAIKRLGVEFSSMQRPGNRVCDYYTCPTEENIFEWHFTMRGPSEPSCPLSKGLYHGILRFPPSYPFEPPDVIFLTPNGRFDTNKPICTSISKFHKDQWRPSFDVTFVLNSLRHFILVEDEVGLGSIPKTSVSQEMKLRMADESWDYYCSHCQCKARDIWNKNMCMHPAVSSAAENDTVADKAAQNAKSEQSTSATGQAVDREENHEDDMRASGSTNIDHVTSKSNRNSSSITRDVRNHQATSTSAAHALASSSHDAADTKAVSGSHDTAAPFSAPLAPPLPHPETRATEGTTEVAHGVATAVSLPGSSSGVTSCSSTATEDATLGSASTSVRVGALGVSLTISLATLDKLIAYSFVTTMLIVTRWTVAWLFVS